SGVFSDFGRGNLSVYNTDVDYYSFTASAGQQFSLTTEDPGSPGATGLYYELRTVSGDYIGGWYTDYYGNLSVGPVTLPSGGSYTVRVSYNYAYEGEYRFRVTLASPPLQTETEGNDSNTSANGLAFTASGAQLTAALAG